VNNGETLREALVRFHRANGLDADESSRASWTCRLGPLTLRLPNFAWRRRAIEAHDLHHVLTGTPCTLLGECRMAAWEFGSGRMPHWCAAAFCLPLVLLGALVAPRTTWRAYAAGRRMRNLHSVEISDALLNAPVSAVRAALRRAE
jgi:ubiquinone biosynthesis protein Coq4